jgi:hypothetical protein
MRRLFKRILNILDGTPAVYGKREKGQSLVEMTAITPLIIILIVGLVEIGWFANNYLILLEVTRVGARRAAVLTGENAPMGWNNLATLPYNRTDLDPFSDEEQYAAANILRANVRNCDILGQQGVYSGFYNLVLCQMVRSMDPIRLRHSDENEVDDVIISVFAIQNVNNAPVNEGGDFHFQADSYNPIVPVEDHEPGYNPIIVGRWPTNANECNMWEAVNDGEIFHFGGWERDPFDYINDGQSPNIVEVHNPNTGQLAATYPMEMAVETENGWATLGFDGELPEFVRGFVFNANHRVELTPDVRQRLGLPEEGPVPVPYPDGGTRLAEPYCFGSNWTIYDVQELLRGSGFKMSQDEIDAMRATYAEFGYEEVLDADGNPTGVMREVDTGKFHGNVGLVLVEIYWQHDLMLDLPVFSPVFNALGTDTIEIYVWSAFPAPSVAPDLSYNLTWQDFTD